MARAKAYTVWIGRTQGVFLSWAECEASIKGFPGAKFKSFGSIEAANAALEQSWEQHITIHKPAPKVATVEDDSCPAHEVVCQESNPVEFSDDEAPF